MLCYLLMALILNCNNGQLFRAPCGKSQTAIQGCRNTIVVSALPTSRTRISIWRTLFELSLWTMCFANELRMREWVELYHEPTIGEQQDEAFIHHQARWVIAAKSATLNWCSGWQRMVNHYKIMLCVKGSPMVTVASHSWDNGSESFPVSCLTAWSQSKWDLNSLNVLNKHIDPWSPWV